MKGSIVFYVLAFCSLVGCLASFWEAFSFGSLIALTVAFIGLVQTVAWVMIGLMWDTVMD